MTPQPTPSTQPKDRRALSHLSHGLTGAIYLFSPEEEQAYNELHAGFLSSWQPENKFQLDLVRSLADDSWRLQRARTFESAIFTEGAEKFASSEEATGDACLDSSFANARTWLAEAKNLNLLTLYESRISRRIEKNTATLLSIQEQRKADLAEAIQEAALLSHAAQLKAENYNAAEAFRARQFEFSPEEISRLIDRYLRLQEAKKLFSGSRKTLHRVA